MQKKIRDISKLWNYDSITISNTDQCRSYFYTSNVNGTTEKYLLKYNVSFEILEFFYISPYSIQYTTLVTQKQLCTLRHPFWRNNVKYVDNVKCVENKHM